MNLKEAFRYQNFLNKTISDIINMLYEQKYCLTVTKTHFRNRANLEAEDMVEEDNEELCATYEELVKCVKKLIEQKEALTSEINKAKPINYDAMIDNNKNSRMLANAIRTSLLFSPSVNTVQGSGYKFNAEGNQMPYKYDIEIATKDRFNREEVKQDYKTILIHADISSRNIDEMLVCTVVKYEPFVNVNSSVEDVINALK